MSVNVIDTIKPKNNGTFPVVEAVDVKVTNDKRLDAALAETNETVAGKQNALSTEQLTAVNSGITSQLVTQIGTNATAISGKEDKANIPFVTPEMFGAVGDGITDDTEAIQAAVATGKAVYFNAKQYKISDSITNPYKIIGSGNKTHIIMTDTTKPIIHITSYRDGLHIEGLRLRYSDTTVAVLSNNVSTAIGIKLDNVSCGQCIFNNLYIYDTYEGIHSDGNFYSCTFSNLWINHFAKAAMYLSGVGSTGCVFSNIYTTNWQDYNNRVRNKSTFGIYLANYTESVMQQINIEHNACSRLLFFNGCDNIKLDSIHFEGIVTTYDYIGMINATSSNLIISTLTMVYSGSNSAGYESTDTTATNVYLFSITNSSANLSSIKCMNVFMRNNAFSYATVNKAIAYSDSTSTNALLDIDQIYDRNDLLKGTVGFINNTRIPQVKALGDIKYYDITHNNIVRQYVDTSPDQLTLAGEFYIGDEFIPKVPTNDNIIKWVVTSKGDMSEPNIAAKAKYEQYRSDVYLTANDTNLKVGVAITIGSRRYTIAAAPYASVTYPDYPFAINLTENIMAASADDVQLKYAQPIITAYKCSTE